MLLEEVVPALAPDGPAWTAEIKFDGYRVMAEVDGVDVRLRSRNGADATRWYPELQSLVDLAEGPLILDGEVCVLDDLGRSDFMLLQDRSRRRGRPVGIHPVVYCVFDLLVLRGRDLRSEPLVARKAALRKLLQPSPANVLFVDDMQGRVHWLYQQAVGLKLEGVVAKRLDSPYRVGERSADWLKVKRPGAVPPQRFKR